MDSATQFLLGASVSGAVLGGKLGARALLIGGLVATLPDLDSFLPMGNDIDDMTYHRGFSHSMLVQTAATPAIAFAITRIVRGARESWKPVMLTVWLCLVTHSILDSLTTYGTQILWPLDVGPPVAFPSVFIIDPLYTSLLLAGVLALFFLRGRIERGVRANRLLLLVSVLYLGVGMSGHLVVQARAEAHPAFRGKSVHVQPTPFNILFWQVLAVDERHYLTGLTSVLPTCSIAQIASHERLAKAPLGLDPSRSARRLEWFTDGFYSYRNNGDTISITDLRIGYHPFFVFSFDIARRQANGYVQMRPTQVGIGPTGPERVKGLLALASRSLERCGV
ncbi:MAG: metal-dependent hydrolase [Hyphomicrobiales bacterium]|nr:metal-dependent hydrolase [Hyphomicrobiales bacterium]